MFDKNDLKTLYSWYYKTLQVEVILANKINNYLPIGKNASLEVRNLPFSSMLELNNALFKILPKYRSVLEQEIGEMQYNKIQDLLEEKLQEPGLLCQKLHDKSFHILENNVECLGKIEQITMAIIDELS